MSKDQLAEAKKVLAAIASGVIIWAKKISATYVARRGALDPFVAVRGRNPVGPGLARTIRRLPGALFRAHGRLSPLDGIGPEDISFHGWRELFDEAASKRSYWRPTFTAEGEATAHYIPAKLGHAPAASRHYRIAYGVPVGGELGYTDRNTLARAMAGRREA